LSSPSSLLPPGNTNKGTGRGRKLIRESMKRYAAKRSILIDNSGNAIAANKTLEGAKAFDQHLQLVDVERRRRTAMSDEAKRKTSNLQVIAEAHKEMSLAERHHFNSMLIGVLSSRVSEDEWKEAIGRTLRYWVGRPKGTESEK
jgi:hypothetical protein